MKEVLRISTIIIHILQIINAGFMALHNLFKICTATERKPDSASTLL